MKNKIHNDSQLLKKLQSGDKDAFRQIYNTYVAELLQYTAQRLSSLEEARDVVQDIFLSFYERLDELNIDTSLRAYLFTAAKYKIVDHIRKNVRKEYYANLLLSLPVKSEDIVFSELVFKDLNTIVEAEIQKFPTRLKETYLLSREQNLSIPEIAVQMQVSEQTVKNQLTTALKRLRPILEKVMVFIPFIYTYLYFLFI